MAGENWTPEQKANIDKALGKMDLSALTDLPMTDAPKLPTHPIPIEREKRPQGHTDHLHMWHPPGSEYVPIQTKERYVTPEQKANVDKALGMANMADARTLPPLEKATLPGGPADLTPRPGIQHLGQTLDKSGVTMDKE